MAGTDNPYAPPQADLSGAGLRDALFRDGKVLVAARDAESLAAAEARIPATIRHGNRAVTAALTSTGRSA